MVRALLRQHRRRALKCGANDEVKHDHLDTYDLESSVAAGRLAKPPRRGQAGHRRGAAAVDDFHRPVLDNIADGVYSISVLSHGLPVRGHDLGRRGRVHVMATLAPSASPSLRLRIMQVLPSVDPAMLHEILRFARVVQFERGDHLASRGDEPAVLIVLEGYVSARRTSPEGRRYSTLLLRPGHVIGFEAIARATVVTDDLVALSDGVAVALPGDGLRNLAARDAGLALRLFDLGMGLAEVMAHRLDQSVFDSAERRVATILLAYEDLLGTTSPAVSRAELASLAGTSREMLGVVIRAFEADGAIRRAGRAIVVHDRNLLHDRAAWESCGAEHTRALTVPPAPPPARSTPGSIPDLRLPLERRPAGPARSAHRHAIGWAGQSRRPRS